MTQQQYDNLKREAEVVNNVFQLLRMGKFAGSVAQDLAIAQMYMQGLAKSLQTELDKHKDALEPLNMNDMEGKPVVVESAVKSNPSPVVVDSVSTSVTA